MTEPADQIKFRLLTYYIADLPLRDQRETMERPFFSLSKRKRVKPIDYRSPDGKVWVEVSPHQKYGMATIWDADILIWAASQIIEHKRRGARPRAAVQAQRAAAGDRSGRQSDRQGKRRALHRPEGRARPPQEH